MRVPDHLHLDVARRVQVALEEHLVGPEGRRGFALGRGHGLGELAGRAHQAHAAAAAAGRRLDQQRVADRGRGGGQLRLAGAARHHGARQHGHARPGHQLLGPRLVAHDAHGLGRGPTQTMPALAQASGRAGFSDRKP